MFPLAVYPCVTSELFTFKPPRFHLGMSSRAPPHRVGSKDLYTWASSELLDECSCLLSTRAIREHKGDSCSYDHRAFARRHDDDIVVLPCTLGEPVCGDERANDGVPFFYFYQVVFKTVNVRLPFSKFEKEVLTETNAAPAQLYPNSWAFVKAFVMAFHVFFLNQSSKNGCGSNG